MRPLYINTPLQTRVVLDGPALKLRGAGRSEQYFPLERLSRVVVTGAVEWQTEALLACSEHAIPVTFLGRDGSVRGVMMGETVRRDTLWGRLWCFLDRPDWEDRFGDWRAAMARRAQLAVARRAGIPQEDFDEQRLVQALAEARKRYAPKPVWRFIDRRMQGLLTALVAELLTDFGLSAGRIGGELGRLRLRHELVELLAWDLKLPVLSLLAEGEPGQAISDRQLTALFERRAARLRRLARQTLNRLDQWAAGVYP